MRNFATALLLVSFVGMAVFGLFIMDMAMSHDGQGCIASQMNGSGKVCPMSMVEMAFHHISVFQSFTSAVISSFSGVAVLLLIVSLAFFSSAGFLLRRFCFQEQGDAPGNILFFKNKKLFAGSPSLSTAPRFR
jgi:hypothetical protein